MLHVQVLVTYMGHTLLTKKETVINAQIKQRFEYNGPCTMYKVGVFHLNIYLRKECPFKKSQLNSRPFD